jgi:sec-independent protein translocase protein TatB
LASLLYVCDTKIKTKMFDFSFSEFSLVTIVALLLIGPEELPGLIRSVRNISRKSRSMFKEFTDSVMEMEEAGGIKDEVRKLNDDIRKITGQDGQLYEAFDISDIMPEIERAKQDAGDKQAEATQEPAAKL